MCMLPLAEAKAELCRYSHCPLSSAIISCFFFLCCYIFIRKLLGQARMKFLHLSYDVQQRECEKFIRIEAFFFNFRMNGISVNMITIEFRRGTILIEFYELFFSFFRTPHAIVVVVHPSFVAAHNATTQLWLWR